ncbi:MAG: hypothetical protein CSA96_08460 [Bacteroidetes bacterium]|nr:MAG: hypothetical protein CSA96_08460 [Bacteroidota bacterium]
MASLTEITGVLGKARAAHLLRRATFGPTIQEIEQFAALNVTEAMALLTDDSADDPTPPIDPLTGETWVDPLGQAHAGGSNSKQDDLHEFFKSWHMDVMRQAAPTLKERITWFFHTHLPARWTEINSSEGIYYQNLLFRFYAFGSFKTLFKKICVDNAMLRYLDCYSNRKNAPNENFAREMFELYSIGKGRQIADGDYTNYTEDDIKAATRVLTGWQIDESFSYLDPDSGIPIGKMRSQFQSDGGQNIEVATEHDEGVKTFSEKFDNAEISPATLLNGYPTVEAAYGELDEMIEMIFAREETSRFIARKLYRFFAYHFISDEVEQDVIGPLARHLRENDYNIVSMLELLMKSEHFYDEDDAAVENDLRGALIKSPVDIFTSLFRFFGIGMPDRDSEPVRFYNEMGFVVNKLVDQGLNFYEPFEVAGYPAYHQVPGFNRNWITSYALAHRYQVGEILMRRVDASEERTLYLDVLDWVENSASIGDPSNATEIIDVFSENLLAVTLNQERYDYFLYTVFLDNPDDHTQALNTWAGEWNNYKSSGSADVVRERIELLLSSLIQTPEFQLI